MEERISRISSRINEELMLTPEQAAAWDQVTAAVDRTKPTVEATCQQLKDGGRPGSTPEKLAAMETMLNTSLQVLQQLRPSVDAFYNSLDADQQATLDQMIPKHRHHH